MCAPFIFKPVQKHKKTDLQNLQVCLFYRVGCEPDYVKNIAAFRLFFAL